MAKRKKQRKNRMKQGGGETRRDLIMRGMMAVVAGEIVKYLPGPKPAVTTILQPAAASLKFTFGTPILKQTATS